jgi:hypothetical protein
MNWVQDTSLLVHELGRLLSIFSGEDGGATGQVPEEQFEWTYPLSNEPLVSPLPESREDELESLSSERHRPKVRRRPQTVPPKRKKKEGIQPSAPPKEAKEGIQPSAPPPLPNAIKETKYPAVPEATKENKYPVLFDQVTESPQEALLKQGFYDIMSILHLSWIQDDGVDLGSVGGRLLKTLEQKYKTFMDESQYNVQGLNTIRLLGLELKEVLLATGRLRKSDPFPQTGEPPQDERKHQAERYLDVIRGNPKDWIQGSFIKWDEYAKNDVYRAWFNNRKQSFNVLYNFVLFLVNRKAEKAKRKQSAGKQSKKKHPKP